MKKKPPIPGGPSAKRPKKIEQAPEMPVLSDDYLNQLNEEQLQQLNDMPIDANTGLVWWQWIERQNGIWAHWPPRAKPAFMQDAA